MSVRIGGGRPGHDVGAAQRGRRGSEARNAACAGWTSLPFLPLIRQPTLILAGADDPLIPLANARLMARLLPAARLHVYPDGHLGLLTSADELAALVSRFTGDPAPLSRH